MTSKPKATCPTPDPMDFCVRVAAFLEICVAMISASGVSEVRHYLDHDEPEMAFEGLILELIAAEAKPFDFDKWRCLGLEMGVDTESVFEADFWCKFEAWGGVGA